MFTSLAAVVGNNTKMATRAPRGADVVQRRHRITYGKLPEAFHHRRIGKTVEGVGCFVEEVVHVQSFRRPRLLPLRKQQLLVGIEKILQ